MLASAPSFTPGVTGNLVPPATLGGGDSTYAELFLGVSGSVPDVQGTSSTASAVAGRVQVGYTAGSSVSGASGCVVAVYGSSDGSLFDSVPLGGLWFQLKAGGAGDTVSLSFELPPGQYLVSLTNADPTYGIEPWATLATIA